MASNPFSSVLGSFDRLYIFGAGGHGREVAWLAEQALGDDVELIYLVDAPEYVTAPMDGVPVRLTSSVVATEGDRFVVAVGDGALRHRAASICLNAGLRPTTIVHPRIEASRFVVLGDGDVICAGSILTTGVTLGKHVHVNIGCTVSHDVTIGDYSTLSPGVHISGHVRIGKYVFIGTGANIINGSASEPLMIGDGATIAAGACVTKSVEPGALMAGVPAIRKR